MAKYGLPVMKRMHDGGISGFQRVTKPKDDRDGIDALHQAKPDPNVPTVDQLTRPSPGVGLVGGVAAQDVAKARSRASDRQNDPGAVRSRFDTQLSAPGSAYCRWSVCFVPRIGPPTNSTSTDRSTFPSLTQNNYPNPEERDTRPSSAATQPRLPPTQISPPSTKRDAKAPVQLIRDYQTDPERERA